jgi:hypothetical protein
MSWTSKGSITASVSIAWATENPVKATMTQPGARVIFSTDLADGAEGILALTWATGVYNTALIWPSNVDWDGNGQAPNPTPWQPRGPRQSDGGVPADAGTSVFKFIRNGSRYIGYMIVAGAPAA